MSLINIFDTETTGFPLWKEPSDDPRQPHLVDIAALLHNEDGELVDSFEAIIRPDGWVIPDEVAAIHGITTEMAMDLGIPEADALEGFLAIHERAGLRVAHNCSFDDRILRIALKRYRGEEAPTAPAPTPRAVPASTSPCRSSSPPRNTRRPRAATFLRCAPRRAAGPFLRYA